MLRKAHYPFQNRKSRFGGQGTPFSPKITIDVRLFVETDIRVDPKDLQECQQYPQALGREPIHTTDHHKKPMQMLQNDL
jgi:hypothetical protein